jgi:hypothetical protein
MKDEELTTPVYLCRRCGQPNQGEAAPDPAGLTADHQLSYMHPECARAEAKDMADARLLARLRLEKVAPDLLRVVIELADTPWEKIHIKALQEKARVALSDYRRLK